MGVHTGDSWTVAPQQTLPDGGATSACATRRSRARAPSASRRAARTSSSRTSRETRELALIEMNPRVSRSSALASKATGFPIAKLAALLAVGYTLDELPNDITGTSSAAFEPALDYVAVKAPRFDFAKFPGAEPTLGTEMRAVGEALGLGRTFPEAFLKALEGVEAGDELPGDRRASTRTSQAELESIRAAERELGGERRRRRGEALRASRRAHRARARRSTRRRCGAGGRCRAGSRSTRAPASSRRGRRTTTSPTRRATARAAARARSSCSAPGRTGSARGSSSTTAACTRRRRSARLGYEVVLVNSNPETVSTDYDTCDRLYLEPVTLERVLDVCRARAAARRRRLARRPDAARGSRPGWPRRACRCSATRSPAIEAAEDRGRFAALLGELGAARARWGVGGDDRDEARARRGASSATRCSCGRHYVLGGRGMRVARDTGGARARTSPRSSTEFLEGALELDVDVLCDGEDGWVAAILEHVEPAGVHSGDSACVLPAPSVTPALEAEIRELAARARAAASAPAGCSTSSSRCTSGELYVLEANPRASRTVPFVAKATGIPLVDHACRLLLGERARRARPARARRARRARGRRRRSSPRERFAGAADRGRRDALDGRGDGRRGDCRRGLPPRAPRGRPRPPAARRSASRFPPADPRRSDVMAAP